MATQEAAVKRPLLAGWQAWVATKKDGRTRLIVGPDAFDAGEDDAFVVPDSNDPTRLVFVASAQESVRQFTSVRPDEYAVIFNPTEQHEEGYPNGKYTPGKNDMKALVYGTKRVVRSGHFPLWPGQRVEVRKIPTLLANQYLVVVVESEDVDEQSPFFPITMRCAEMFKDVGEETEPASAAVASENTPAVGTGRKLRLRQRIIIPGSVTPTYIPPTGIEIVPEEGSHQTIRDAAVPGPTQFCVLIDQNGRRRTERGPDCIFPGPNDRFQTEGSDDRIYDAYHIRPDMGLLIRIVATSMPAQKLSEQLPQGVELSVESVLGQGDEIFIGGTDAYVFPSADFDIIDPETRQPHIGNDHRSVYVMAVGVDDKSGTYLAQIETGQVKLVRGPVKLLPDPRKQRHVKRRVPGRMWNLMIGAGEPHKCVRPETMVETPWALCITVPNNEAALITHKGGRKPVVGPCMELLDYEATLEVLRLSRNDAQGVKSEEKPLETCFLRVKGNRVTDVVELVTSDFVSLQVRVAYGVQFVGDTEEERAAWFNHRNYVQFLCDQCRSRLRAAAQQKSIRELNGGIIDSANVQRGGMAEFIRDTILQPKATAEGHRPGLKFAENNMLVHEVEVLAVSIPDKAVAEQLTTTNRKVVIQQILDAAGKAEVDSAESRNARQARLAELNQIEVERGQNLKIEQAKAEDAVARSIHDLETARKQRAFEDEFSMLKRRQENELALQRAKNDMNDETAARELARKEAAEKQRQKLAQTDHAIAEAHAKGEAEIELTVSAAAAEADAKRLAAVTPGLVEALKGFGNTELAKTLAERLPSASGQLPSLFGPNGIEALRALVKDTPIAGALNALGNEKNR